MYTKLLGIISMDFDVINYCQLLFRYSGFVRYWRKM